MIQICQQNSGCDWFLSQEVDVIVTDSWEMHIKIYMTDSNMNLFEKRQNVQQDPKTDRY